LEDAAFTWRDTCRFTPAAAAAGLLEAAGAAAGVPALNPASMPGSCFPSSNAIAAVGKVKLLKRSQGQVQRLRRKLQLSAEISLHDLHKNCYPCAQRARQGRRAKRKFKAQQSAHSGVFSSREQHSRGWL
jgi:hypothetical protein